jgi:hypothetical protein
MAQLLLMLRNTTAVTSESVVQAASPLLVEHIPAKHAYGRVILARYATAVDKHRK